MARWREGTFPDRGVNRAGGSPETVLPSASAEPYLHSMPEKDEPTPAETLVDKLAGGRIIDARYRLERLLGRGGMGVVWLARDEILNRPVAMKFLAEMLAHDRAAIEDLKHETSRCLELTHPRIVRIYDFVQDAGLAAISMELVEGHTLSELRSQRPHRCFDPDAVRDWMDQLAEALTYAHRERRVVHRDLKPSNLMIDGANLLKVSDFGIARSISDSMSRISGVAKVSGTIGYMSPQQAQGLAPSEGDDIYAVGATLFELLTGKPPFHGPAALVFQQLLHVEAPSVNEKRRELTNDQCAPVPPTWEATIAACLAKDPADRPKTVREIADRLRGDTGTHVAATQTMTLPPPPARAVAKTDGIPWVWSGVLAAGVVAVGAMGWALWKPATIQSVLPPLAATTPQPTPAPPITPAATPRLVALPSPTPQIAAAPVPTPKPATPVPPPPPVAVVTPTPVPSPTPVARTEPSTPPPAKMAAESKPKAKPRTSKPAPATTERSTAPVPKRKAQASVAESTPIPRPKAETAPKPTPERSGVTEEERKRAAAARLMIERLRGPTR